MSPGEPPPTVALLEVLERSRELGLLGPGPVQDHLDHARAWRSLIPRGARVLDLGSGGGVPGLPLAVERPDCHVVLLDGMERRGRVLRDAVVRLGLTGRVEVVVARAEEAGRSLELRGQFDVVTARSFAPPAVTAECAAPFLRPGGRLLVSEPPNPEEDRWPASGLAELGLRAEGVVTAERATIRVLMQDAPCPDRYPRAVGRPMKRPLF